MNIFCSSVEKSRNAKRKEKKRKNDWLEYDFDSDNILKAR